MNIIIVNYPYQEYEVGDTVDLGERKNKSMVDMGRAIWEITPEVKPKTEEQKVEPVVEDEEEAPPEEEPITEKEEETSTDEPEEKVLENKTRKAIQKKKGSKSGFWDNLK